MGEVRYRASTTDPLYPNHIVNSEGTLLIWEDVHTKLFQLLPVDESLCVTVTKFFQLLEKLVVKRGKGPSMVENLLTNSHLARVKKRQRILGEGKSAHRIIAQCNNIPVIPYSSIPHMCDKFPLQSHLPGPQYLPRPKYIRSLHFEQIH